MDIETHDKLCETYWDIWDRCQSDPEYDRLKGELTALEPQYEAILSALPEPDQVLLDRYITIRESMNHRMLEFACAELHKSM